MVANPGDRLSQCCDNLSDEEYREWLAALTRKHAIETWTPFHERDAVEVLTSVARLANAARPLTRVVNPTLANPGLAGVVAGQVRQSQYAVVQVIDAMDSSGVLDALDELPEVTFGQLRRSAISEDDARLLARAGVDDAEAEITVAIYYARRRLGHGHSHPSAIARSAASELEAAAGRLDVAGVPPQPKGPDAKPKKIFNGIGKILNGMVAGGGNLLLLTGTIVTPNPATGISHWDHQRWRSASLLKALETSAASNAS